MYEMLLLASGLDQASSKNILFRPDVNWSPNCFMRKVFVKLVVFVHSLFGPQLFTKNYFAVGRERLEPARLHSSNDHPCVWSPWDCACRSQRLELAGDKRHQFSRQWWFASEEVAWRWSSIPNCRRAGRHSNLGFKRVSCLEDWALRCECWQSERTVVSKVEAVWTDCKLDYVSCFVLLTPIFQCCLCVQSEVIRRNQKLS